MNLTGNWVMYGNCLPSPVNKDLLSSLMVLAHNDIEMFGPLPVMVAELGYQWPLENPQWISFRRPVDHFYVAARSLFGIVAGRVCREKTAH
jgi:hypothetical protein